MSPDRLAGAAYVAAAYAAMYVDFTHKLGNPLLQILDPPLSQLH